MLNKQELRIADWFCSPSEYRSICSRCDPRPVTPVDALPQRHNFVTTTAATNTTQPFGVSDQIEAPVPQRQERNDRQNQGENTTSSYRRRERRVRQRQYREIV